MRLPQVVPPADWEAARAALLVKEKAATQVRDALAAERRRLPMVRVEQQYVFDGPDSEASLLDLFDGRRQLIVYHHMLKPGDDDPCSGCSMFVDNIGHLAHLHARDTSLVLVSRAPSAEIEAFTKRMGWTIPWFSSARSSFDANFGVTTSFGLNVFLRDGGEVFHTYFRTGRGVEALGSNWSFLGLTPLGRQEDWEESPEGWPQARPYECGACTTSTTAQWRGLRVGRQRINPRAARSTQLGHKDATHWAQEHDTLGTRARHAGRG